MAACVCRHPSSKRSRAHTTLPDSPASSSGLSYATPTTSSEHPNFDPASLPRLPPDLRPRHFHPSDKLPYRNKNAPILSRVESHDTGYPPTNWPPTAIHGLSPFQPTTTRRNPVTHRGYDYLKEELEPRLARTEHMMKDLFHHRGERTAQRIAQLGSPSSSCPSSQSQTPTRTSQPHHAPCSCAHLGTPHCRCSPASSSSL